MTRRHLRLALVVLALGLLPGSMPGLPAQSAIAPAPAFTAAELAELTETAGPAGFRFLRSVAGACIALDRTVPGRYPCRIYARRPDDCRDVAPGSEWCLAARRAGRLLSLPAR